MKILKWVAGVLGVLILGLAAFIAFLSFKGPNVRPAPEVKVEGTPEQVERGRYVAQNLAACFSCHTERDWTVYAAPAKAGAPMGGGGDCYLGMPDQVCPSNITPHPEAGLGRWTDGEILRALREGVDREGKVLHPGHPFMIYVMMDDADARAVVAYLRTLPPSDKRLPETQLSFMTRVQAQQMTQPIEGPVSAPPAGETPEYGQYLANIAGCTGCHGEDLSGGYEINIGHGGAFARNITPDPDTGIGSWTREMFIGRFKQWQSVPDDSKAPPGQVSLMAWRDFAGMSEQDLGAIYAFLKSRPPVKKSVTAFPTAGQTTP